MDLTKSQESDTDTETPLQTHLTRALSLTNGALHPHHHHQPPPLPPPHLVLVSYKECLKNHAATLGGLALDGCGEFLPSPSATPLDPTSLKCAACGCHRNFHRREPYSPRQIPPPPVLQWTSSPSPGQTSPSSSSPAASPTPQQSVYPSAPHMLLALSTGHSGPVDENQYGNLNPTAMNPHGRKRARTKFTEEQKEKMYVFAEKLGWRMVRAGDDKTVEDFCSEIGVKRNVFKVWMHNNKQRIKDKANGNGNGFDSDVHNGKNKTMNCNGNNEEDEGAGFKAACSSSPDASSP